MNILTLNIGALGTNCYVVTDTDYILVIDPADAVDKLLDAVKPYVNRKHKYILLTHCHIDHILGAEAVKQLLNCPIIISAEDAGLLARAEYNLSQMIFGRDYALYADKTVTEGEEISLGGIKLTVLHTPGHTPGSVCYKLGNNLFCGDTIFCGSIGRTDFPASSTAQMLKSLKRLGGITENYTLYPGHNEPTTLEHEKKYNPFMRF